MKLALRKIIYKKFFRELICNLIVGYMKLVYYTCKVKFINYETLIEPVGNKQPLIMAFWHNRLAMTPFAAQKIKKSYPHYNLMTLSSKHGDGQFVGRIVEKLNLISVLGSTQNNHKERSRGINISSFKQIFSGLKKGYSLGITPDGPRGPNQKLNSELVNIARMSGAGILPLSYSCSRFIELRTWDKFKIPLPFSKICFYFDNKIIYVSKNADNYDVESINKTVEERMNFVQDESQKQFANF